MEEGQGGAAMFTGGDQEVSWGSVPHPPPGQVARLMGQRGRIWVGSGTPGGFWNPSGDLRSSTSSL